MYPLEAKLLAEGMRPIVSVLKLPMYASVHGSLSPDPAWLDVSIQFLKNLNRKISISSRKPRNISSNKKNQDILSGRCPSYANGGSEKAKLVRAQGGCLGTESRRKT